MENNPKRKKRIRKLTDLTLNWLSERFKKCQNIKEQLKDGKYNIDPSKVAEAILDKEN